MKLRRSVLDQIYGEEPVTGGSQAPRPDSGRKRSVLDEVYDPQPVNLTAQDRLSPNNRRHVTLPPQIAEPTAGQQDVARAVFAPLHLDVPQPDEQLHPERTPAIQRRIAGDYRSGEAPDASTLERMGGKLTAAARHLPGEAVRLANAFVTRPIEDVGITLAGGPAGGQRTAPLPTILPRHAGPEGGSVRRTPEAMARQTEAQMAYDAQQADEGYGLHPVSQVGEKGAEALDQVFGADPEHGRTLANVALQIAALGEPLVGGARNLLAKRPMVGETPQPEALVQGPTRTRRVGDARLPDVEAIVEQRRAQRAQAMAGREAPPEAPVERPAAPPSPEPPTAAPESPTPLQAAYEAQQQAPPTGEVAGAVPHVEPLSAAPTVAPEPPKPPPPPVNPASLERPMRVNRLDLPPDLAARVAGHVAREEAARPTIPWEQVREDAAKILQTKPESLKTLDPNRASGAEILGIAHTVRENQVQLGNLSKQLLDATPEGKADLVAQISRLEGDQSLLVSKMVRGGSQMGRDLNTLKMLANLNNDPVHWMVRAQRLAERPLTQVERDTITRYATSAQQVTRQDVLDFVRKKAYQQAASETGAVGDIGKILEKYKRTTLKRELTPEEFQTVFDHLMNQRRAELLRYVGTLRKAGLGTKAVSAWKAGLLSSPVTHAVNITANTTFAIAEDVAQSPAAFADWAMSLGSGQRTKTPLSARQFWTEWAGMGQGKGKPRIGGAWPGVKEIPNVMRGLPVGEELQAGKVPWETHFTNPIANAMVNGPFRALNASDRVFAGAAYTKSLAEQAVLRANTMKLTGPGRKAFITEAITNPTDDMIWRAGQDALVRTFRDQTAAGNVLAGVQKGLGPVGQIAVPFTRTPGAVATRLAEGSPYGIIKGTVKGTQAVRAIRRALASGEGLTPELLRAQQVAAETIGRGTLGTGYMLAGYVLYKRGLINGALPSEDRTGRETAYLTGEVPGAVKVGNTRIDIVRTGLPAMALVMGATMAQMFEQTHGDPIDKVGQAAGAGAALITDQPFLQGVQQMLDILRDPTNIGAGLKRQVGSLVPSVVAAVARTADPTVRVKGGVLDELKARIPGLSQTLPAKVGPLGDQQSLSSRGAQNLFSPVRVSTVPRDPAIDAIRESGARVTGRQRGKQETLKVGQREVTIPAETAALYAERLRTEGPIVRKAVEELIRSPRYKQAYPPEQADMIEEAITKTRSRLSATRRRDALRVPQ